MHQTVAGRQIGLKRFLTHTVIPLFLTFGFLSLAIFTIQIPSMRQHMMDARREMVAELVNTAWSLVRSHWLEVERGTITREEAQRQVKDRIRDLRYGRSSQDYFFIMDMNLHSVVQPYRPDHEGRDMSEIQDPTGFRFFEAFARMVLSHGQGYVSYMWQKNDRPEEVHTKLSFVRGFAPWGWIIGTGAYVDDVEAAIMDLTWKILRPLLFVLSVMLILSTWLTLRIYRQEKQVIKTRTALDASEQRFQHLSVNIPGIVFQLVLRADGEMRFAYLNDQGRRLFEAPEGLDGALDLMLSRMSEEDRQRFVRTIGEAARTGGEWHVQFAYQKPDQPPLWFNGLSYPITQNGETRFDGVLLDVTRRKAAETALAEALAQLRNILDAATQIALIATDKLGKITLFNRGAEQLLGYFADEVVGISTPERFHEPRELGERIRQLSDELGQSVTWGELFSLSLQRGRHLPREWTYISRSGAVIPVELVVTPTRDQRGKKTGYLGIVTDISERRRAAESLRQSEEKYRNIFNGVNDAILILNPDDLTVAAANQKASTLLGLKEEDLGVTTLLRLSAHREGLSTARLTASIDRVRTGQPQLFEWMLQNHAGERFWVEINMELSHIGQKVKLVAIIRDIRERKAAQEEVRRLRNYLGNIINSMPSILVGIDRQGLVTQWNHQAELHTGLGSEEAMGRHLGSLMPELEADLNRLETIISTGTPLERGKTPWRSEGETRFYDITFYPLIADGVEGAVLRIDDVSERVHLEEMMIQSEKMLSLGGLAAGMAHEINNPLASILQNLQVLENRINLRSPRDRAALQKMNLDEGGLNRFFAERQIQDLLGHAGASARRAGDIVRNMLSFARKGDAHKEPEDLEDLIETTLSLCQNDYDLNSRYDFRRMRIIREYTPNLPRVNCERTKIQQVLLNILKNGAQAMQSEEKEGSEAPAPCLRIHLTADPPFVRLDIEDNGPGMSDAVCKRIFEPFFTTKGSGSGTGLGLSVSYFIITEIHGGQLSASSIPGQGSTFTIRLPASDTPVV